MEIIFRNATVVTMNPAQPVLHNANVGIADGKIFFVSADANAPRIIDCAHKVLMPGLYNCHTHAAMTLFRGFANDKKLEDWLFNHLIPAEAKLTPELVRTGTILAMAEMISSGTVAFSDMYCHMDFVAAAAREVGMLANICNGVVGFGDDFDFFKCNEFLQTSRALAENSAGTENSSDGKIKIEAAIHGCYTSFPPTWQKISDWAKKNNLRIHVHLSETKFEHENCVKNFGATPAKIFAQHGVFDSPTLAAHGVWLTDDDMEILREKNVSVAHNPLSNLKLASGLAPVTKMLEKNINVALGTDGVASNNSHDLFEEMKMASLLQKFCANDPTVLPAFESLKMATVNGARAQGREKSGALIEGFDADMILVDFDNPRQTMCYDPILNLAYATSGRDVQMTIVRGKILYENGEFTTIDIEKILRDARKAKEIFL